MATRKTLDPVQATDALVQAGLLEHLRDDVLLPHWLDWHDSRSRQPGLFGLRDGEVPCIQTCRHTTLFTQRILAELGIETTPVWGECKVGEAGGPHAWLDIGGHVLDLTAEQFGGPTVVWAAAEGLPAPLRYEPDTDPRTIKPLLRSIRPTVKEWELVRRGWGPDQTTAPDPARQAWLRTARVLLQLGPVSPVSGRDRGTRRR